MYYVREKKGGLIELGNCGMITGAFSSTSGKADITLTTNGDVLYYNSGRQRLAIGDEGQVLTVSGSDLPSWATASGATLEKLGSYRATSAELSKSFTSLSLDLDADYSYLIVTVCGEISGNSALGIGLNGVTGTAYNYTYIRNASGTLSGASGANQNHIHFCGSALLDTDDDFNFQILIKYTGATANLFSVIVNGGTYGTDVGNQNTMGVADAGGATVTAVDIASTGENWEIGTQIDLYGVKL